MHMLAACMQGFEESSLPLPKALQKAGAAATSAAKLAASSVRSAAKAVTPAAPAPPLKVKKAFVNPLLQKRQGAPAAPVEASKQAPTGPTKHLLESSGGEKAEPCSQTGGGREKGLREPSDAEARSRRCAQEGGFQECPRTCSCRCQRYTQITFFYSLCILFVTWPIAAAGYGT
jgi:hypothetical protein